MSRFGVRAARTSRRGFAKQHRITRFPLMRSPSALRLHEVRICLHLALRPWTWTTIATLGYLPASPLLIRLPTTGSGPVLPCAVRPEGHGAQARTVSITGLGMGGPSPVREYQPVVHRLRLSASP